MKKKLSSKDLDKIIELIDESISRELRRDRVIAAANLVVSLEYDEDKSELNTNVIVEVRQRVKGLEGPEARVDKLLRTIERVLDDALAGVGEKTEEGSRGGSGEEGSGSGNP